MAWMTLNRATRTLASTMVVRAIANPTTKPVSTVDDRNANVRWRAVTSRPVSRIWSARQAISHPKPIPRAAPSALAGTA